MSKNIGDFFPPVEEALELETEDLAFCVLKHLDALQIAERHFNLGNYVRSGDFDQYAGSRRQEFDRAISEAWMWLEKEILLAPDPRVDRMRDWVIITRRGLSLLKDSGMDIHTYLRSNFLPKEVLDPVLVTAVRPLFLKGDYDTAVFRAFKEVEVRVRKAAQLGPEILGANLMDRAFNPKDGLLTDKQAVHSEQEATHHLFRGAIGLFKNPSSHREVNWEDPFECAELIMFADYLLRLVRKRSEEAFIEAAKT